jgi:ParB/RepB/Spo0J family partition protein
MAQIREIEIQKLFIGKCNVRKEIGNLTELTASIKEKGVLQPIIVRPVEGRYEIIVGARRFEAAKAARLEKIPAIIREMGDDEAIATSLIENIQRGNLEPEEEAEAINRLVEIYRSITKVAKTLGISQRTIRKKISVLELLPKARKEVPVKFAPPIEERREGRALPFEHATLVAEAFRIEEVKLLPEKERARKQVELAKMIAPLPQHEAKKVVDYFKMYPEKSMEEIKEKALAKATGVALRTYLTPTMAREIDTIAEGKGLALEEIVPELLEKGLEVEKASIRKVEREPKIIAEIDTGEIWLCPICGKEFHLIHCKPTNTHKLEEVPK